MKIVAMKTKALDATGCSPVKLGDIVTFNPRRAIHDLPLATPVAYVTLSGLNASAATAAPVVCRLDAAPMKTVKFAHGDVLAASQLTALQAGRVAHADIEQDIGFCGPHLYALRADPARLDARYLLHFLRQPRLRTMIATYWKNDGGRHLSALDFLKNLTLALPPLAEQQRHAARLDGLLTDCAQQRRALSRFDQSRLAHFIHVFGDADTLMRRWPRVSLGFEVETIRCGVRGWSNFRAKRGALLISPHHLDGNRLLAGPKNYVRIAPDHLLARQTRVQPNDVLMTMGRERIRTLVAPAGIGDVYIDQDMVILRGCTVDPVFLAAYLRSPMVAETITHLVRAHPGKLKRVGIRDIRALNVPLPPQHLQQEFVQMMLRLDRQEDLAHAQLARLGERLDHVERAAFRLPQPAHMEPRQQDVPAAMAKRRPHHAQGAACHAA
jgi:type I restriction enzyme S subunit